jgi:hypothetical protein
VCSTPIQNKAMPDEPRDGYLAIPHPITRQEKTRRRIACPAQNIPLVEKRRTKTKAMPEMYHKPVVIKYFGFPFLKPVQIVQNISFIIRRVR